MSNKALTLLDGKLVEFTWDKETETQVKDISLEGRKLVHKVNMYKVNAKKMKEYNKVQEKIDALNKKAEEILSSMKKYY